MRMKNKQTTQEKLKLIEQKIVELQEENAILKEELREKNSSQPSVEIN